MVRAKVRILVTVGAKIVVRVGLGLILGFG